MALIQHGSVSGTCALRLSFSSSAPPPSSPPPRVSLNFLPEKKGWGRSCFRRLICRAMVQESLQGIPSVYAREMERLSAKKSLILAMIDDQDLGFIVNFLGIFIFPLVIAYHYVAADPKYEAT